MGLLDSHFLVDVEHHGTFRVDFLEDRDLLFYGLEAKLPVLEDQYPFL